MTDKLTPEQRKRVAEAATGSRCRIVKAHKDKHIRIRDGYDYRWQPEQINYQWKALVTWLAKHHYFHPRQLTDVLVRFIANNNTEGLERMACEILEAQDD